MSIRPHEREFASWLRQLLQERGIQQKQLARVLHLDKSNIGHRVNGRVPFSREEVARLDEAWGENGALLRRAGFLESDSRLLLPDSRYIDQEWVNERLDEAYAISTSHTIGSGARAEKYFKMLLEHLESLKDDQTLRKHLTRTRLDLLELQGDMYGVNDALFRLACDLRISVEEAEDKELDHVYALTMSNLALGADRFEDALGYQQRAFLLAGKLEDDNEILASKIDLANAYSYVDPENPDAMELLDAASSMLEVNRYFLGEWPSELPSYLDVLQSRLNLYLGQDTNQAGETLETILHNFFPSPYASDNITTLLAAAEFYARDHQARLMEENLHQVESLMKRYELNWYQGDAERVRLLLPD